MNRFWTLSKTTTWRSQKSKRRSATSDPLSPPERIFFTDRDLGKQVASLLRANGLRVETYFDAFPGPILPDAEWLAEVSRRGWVALSHDRDIRYDPLAQRAVMENGGRLFLLRGQTSHAELAKMFVRAIKRVERFLEKRTPPFMAIVRRAATHEDPLRVEVAMALTLEKWRSGKVDREGPDPQDLPL